MLAYLSDWSLLDTATLPHAVSFMQCNMQVASLDHAMWFHRPFRADEWLLYVQDSPSASGARGLNRGLIYNQAGRPGGLSGPGRSDPDPRRRLSASARSYR